MLDFILLEQEILESANTIDDEKLTRIEIRKLLKAKDWFITQPGTKPCLLGLILLVNCSPIAMPPMHTVVSPPKTVAAIEFSKGIKQDVTQ